MLNRSVSVTHAAAAAAASPAQEDASTFIQPRVGSQEIFQITLRGISQKILELVVRNLRFAIMIIIIRIVVVVVILDSFVKQKLLVQQIRFAVIQIDEIAQLFGQDSLSV